MRLRTAALTFALSLVACSPEPPRLTPQSSEVTGVSSQGLGLRVHLNANNPNRVDLTVQSVDVRVTLAARDLGRSVLNDRTRLPAGRDVALSLDLNAPWGDLPGLLMVTALNENVPYQLDGTVRVGGERVQLQVPFHLESTVPRSVLLSAAGSLVPGSH